MKRYKILRNRPEISSEEASQIADFNQLMQAHQISKSSYPSLRRMVMSLLLLAALTGLVFYGIRKDSFEVTFPETITNEYSQSATQSSALEQKDTESHPERFIAESPALVPESQKQENSSQVAPVEIIAKTEAEKEPVTSGYVEAVPIDGFPALYQYFDDHLEYPREMLNEGIEGSVIVKFVIDTEGMTSTIVIEKSLHEKLDSTAIALILNMPRWNPAKLNGKPILSTHRIPLFFQIDQKLK